LITVIVPDDKNWTWVLDRPCPDCGFDASSCPAETVPDLLRANALSWQRLLEAGVIQRNRPVETVWSPLEYACHVRDLYARFAERIEMMCEEEDPLFPNWDQDASAIADRYSEQDPGTAVEGLFVNAGALAELLAGIPAGVWQRSGRRSDGASFTVDSISRYMIHDPIHHLWDVENSDIESGTSCRQPRPRPGLPGSR
jgi:hypothetical protein